MAAKRKQPEKVMIRQTTRKAKVTTAKDSLLPSDYLEVLEDIKEKVVAARIRASLSVNRELIILCWEIGRLILQRQEAEGWGAKVIDRLSVDLCGEFPDYKGFSSRNLKYMRKFKGELPTAKQIEKGIGKT